MRIPRTALRPALIGLIAVAGLAAAPGIAEATCRNGATDWPTCTPPTTTTQPPAPTTTEAPAPTTTVDTVPDSTFPPDTPPVTMPPEPADPVTTPPYIITPPPVDRCKLIDPSTGLYYDPPQYADSNWIVLGGREGMIGTTHSGLPCAYPPVVTTPEPTAPTPNQPDSTPSLPETGAMTLPGALAAIALLSAGGGAAAIARRRPT